MTRWLSTFALVACGSAWLAAGEPELDDLFEGLPPAEKRSSDDKPAVRDPALLPGEDIELGGSADPFARIAKKMQRSQQALVAGNTRPETQDLQEEILLDLDALLKNLEKKCAGGQCNKPGSSSSSGNSTAGTKPSTKPATDSTARVGEPGDTTSDESSSGDALRDVWGHRPPTVREAMINAQLEEFLPKYDRLIQEFYRRLAEQPARGS